MTYSQPIATVNLTNCHQLKNTSLPFILTLGEGENIFSALQLCATKIALPSASFTALGALQNVKMGYYHQATKQHTIKIFEDVYEIASLIGSITCNNSEPFIHIHAGISHLDFIVYGGHLIDAHSGPASEFIITPFAAPIHRHFNALLGIYTICKENPSCK